MGILYREDIRIPYLSKLRRLYRQAAFYLRVVRTFK
jgi:hypothetical protein